MQSSDNTMTVLESVLSQASAKKPCVQDIMNFPLVPYLESNEDQLFSGRALENSIEPFRLPNSMLDEGLPQISPFDPSDIKQEQINKIHSGKRQYMEEPQFNKEQDIVEKNRMLARLKRRKEKISLSILKNQIVVLTKEISLCKFRIKVFEDKLEDNGTKSSLIQQLLDEVKYTKYNSKEDKKLTLEIFGKFINGKVMTKQEGVYRRKFTPYSPKNVQSTSDLIKLQKHFQLFNIDNKDKQEQKLISF